MKRILMLLVALIALTNAPSHAATVRVFAAASLSEAFKEIGAAYQTAHPGDNVEFNFAGSPTLRTQIEQGAPADVFAAADSANMTTLSKEGLAAPSKVFAHNKLAVVAAANSRKVRYLQDIGNPGVTLVLADPSVPIGHYADDVLGKLAVAYTSDFVIKAQTNIVSRELNVKAVLAKVQLGEADAGFVYVTDAKAAGAAVKTINVPDKYNVVASYPIAPVKQPANAAGAASFVDFVMGTDGQAILRKFGFLK